jgi:hypothetical protein
LIRFAELGLAHTRDLLTISHRTAGALASNEGVYLRGDGFLGPSGRVEYAVAAGEGAQGKPGKGFRRSLTSGASRSGRLVHRAERSFVWYESRIRPELSV